MAPRIRTAPWLGEQRVDARRASALLARRLGLRGEVRALGEGWDSAAFQLEDAVFRFPKRSSVVPHLRSEIEVLPLLGGLPIAVPQPMWVAEPDEDYPFPFMGYPMLPGRPLDQVRGLSRAEIEALLVQIVDFLDALHAIPISGPVVRVAGWPMLPASRYPHPAADRARAYLNANPIAPDRQGVLLHGDLWPGHVLVDLEGRAVGVIDFGDLEIGDKAKDLVGLVVWQPARLAEIAPLEDLARAWSYAIHFALQDFAILSHWSPLSAREAAREIDRRIAAAEKMLRP